MDKPFTEPNKVADAVADVLAKSQQARADSIPDEITTAAKAAGVELRATGNVSSEIKTSIYNKHFSKAVGTDPVSSDTRSNFERIADQEYSSTTTATE